MCSIPDLIIHDFNNFPEANISGSFIKHHGYISHWHAKYQSEQTIP
jgi:hypothetical protein